MAASCVRPPSAHPDHVRLTQVLEIRRKVGGTWGVLGNSGATPVFADNASAGLEAAETAVRGMTRLGKMIRIFGHSASASPHSDLLLGTAGNGLLI